MKETKITRKALLEVMSEEEGTTVYHTGIAKVEVILEKLGITIEQLDKYVLEHPKFYYTDYKAFLKFNDKITKAEDVPAVLYHTTSKKFKKAIKKEGLKADKNYSENACVHLATDVNFVHHLFDTMHMYDKKKKDRKSITYAIDAKQMVENNYAFFNGQHGIWMVENVPAKYLTIIK